MKIVNSLYLLGLADDQMQGYKMMNWLLFLEKAIAFLKKSKEEAYIAKSHYEEKVGLQKLNSLAKMFYYATIKKQLPLQNI